MAAEMDISMSVRVFEELTFTKAEPNGIFSIKMRANYNVLTGHPNKTHDWQRAYFYVKSDEHAFEELPGDDYRVLWNQQLVRHPNTIAYPEKFFESAQLIATHSHLRWPDLSREWIRRQQARIARVDWESRIPCVLGPRKSRLSLFTRKQQKLLNKARKMEGIPDLSALLKGKLQMLSSKSSSAGASEARPTPADGDVNSEPPARSSLKKKTSKTKKQAKKGQPSSLEGNVPLEEAPSSADASDVAAKKKKKKNDGKKRSREETSVEPAETSTAVGSDDAGRHDPNDSTRWSSDERPKKKAKKTAVEDDGQRGGTLVFEQAMASKRSDGSMNYLVEKLSVIERIRTENKKASDKAAKEKEVLRVKFEELEEKLKSDRLAKKEALRENTRLERLVASLEKEKAELEGERDAVVGTLVKERQRLRDSMVQEVTRERIKVQTAVADKSTRCVGKMKDYLDRLNALEKAKSLYG
ncbi:uncharacterized protein LOC103849824 [Brassica rapa]|uniref:uncharacterized protein LOC103849824 n=1 Tax=Brassica campestris TaxID=3711 RepID=UPI0004F16F41|nr:uncharacterized protein LOC103849824 [Brassica rapa]